MKTFVLVLILCFCATQMFYAQEDEGMTSLSLPVRNSLTFNRYVINPTFSFVREQNKYISFSNKREWVQFEDAPLTYLGSYTGRLAENMGAGIGVFQQNYGVYTTFGGVLNFAYNARLARESNLTFGLNIGAFNSGLNTGQVVTNFSSDPSLQNVPDYFMLTVNPGINYGTAFFDFGVSVNNLVTYNVQASSLIEDNPELGIQAHLMYTGYMDSRGFFDQSKFSGLIRSEFKQEETIISALAMLTIPKGIWGQVGYNNVYGVSGGLGINITPQIAIEYNFEKTIGDLTDFGSSHDITLAYRFKNRETYYYSSGDEIGGLISPDTKRKRPLPKKSEKKAEANRKLAEEAKARIKANQEAKAREEAEAKERLLAEQKAKEEAEAREKLLAEQKAKEEAEAREKLLAEQKAKEEAEAKEKLLAEQKAKEEAEAREKLLAEQKAKEEAEAREKLLAEQKAKEEAEAREKLLAEQKAKEEAEAREKLLAEQKAKEEAEAREKLLAEQKAKEEAEAREKLLAEQKAKEEAEAREKLLAEQKAKEEAEAREKLLAEQKAKEEAEAREKLLAEQKAKEEAEAREKLLAEQKAKEEAEAREKLLAEQKAKEEAEAREKLLAEQKAKEEAEAREKLLAEQKAKEELITNPKDDHGKAMYALIQKTENSKTKQDELLKKIDEIVEIKNQDLKDLKEENDLSEQGIVTQPKPFKNLTEENNRLKAMISDLDSVITARSEAIDELKSLYNEKYDENEEKIGTIYLDEVYLYYKKELDRLTAEQIEAAQAKLKLELRLEEIRVATEFERNRRIKRAAFDNEEERYASDRATLKNIKENTAIGGQIYKTEDFDFGEEQSGNIQILKNVNHVSNGYYLIIAVHNDIQKRNEFVEKVYASGRADVDFFYDVNTSKYYIYYDKFDYIEAANEALKLKGTKPYNVNMSLVKIEN